MKETPTRVLLVEDNIADAKLVQEALANAAGHPFRIEWLRELPAVLEKLSRVKYEVILLDLTLAGSQGLAVFNQVYAVAPESLILILSSAEDETIARQAVQHGADDYLVKGHVDAHWLPRALYYLLERKEIREALRSSEARFRAMSDASPLGIFVSDG